METWRRQPPSVRDDDFTGRRRRLSTWRFGLTAAALALVVWLIALVVGERRQVPMVVGIVPSYPAPLGPLALAEEDRRLLAGLSRGSVIDPGTARIIDISAVMRQADAGQLAAAFAQPLAAPAMRLGGPDGRMAIVYITAIGAVDRVGKACIIPPRTAGSRGPADEQWLRVETLLAELAEARPRGATLLVVLDTCRAAHGEPLGVIDGTFATALAVDVQAAARDGVWVLASAGPGETACAAPADGCSVFADAFAEGLEGAADQKPWGNDDGRIALDELAAFLADEVDRRAIVYHGRRQRPFMVPSPRDQGRDRRVAWAVRSSSQRRDARSTTLGPQAVEWLRERWSAAQRLRDRAVQERPLAWATYESTLLRAERLHQAGAGAADEIPAARTAVETLEQQIAQSLVDGSDLPGVRLAELVSGEPQPADAAWLALLDGWARGVADRSIAAPATDDPVAPCVDSEQWRARATAGWRRLVSLFESGASVDRDAWERWDVLIGGPPGGEGIVPGEIHAARLLASGIAPDGWAAATAFAGRVMSLAQDAAEATLPDDVRADPFVDMAAPTHAAHLARRAAFDLVIIGDDVSLARAAEKGRTAGEAYRATANAGRVMSAAWRLLDRMRSEGPWLAVWRARMSSASGGTGADVVSADRTIDWKKLSAAFRKLESAVQLAGSSSQGPPASLEPLRQAFKEADALFTSLRSEHDDGCVALARAADNASTLAAIHDVLALPLIDGERRMELLVKAGTIAGQLRSQSPSIRDRSQTAAGAPGVESPAPGTGSAPATHPFVVTLGLSDELDVRPSMSVADAAGAWGHAIRAAAGQLPMLCSTRATETTVADTASAAATARRLSVLAPVGLADATVDLDHSPITLQLHRAWHERLTAVARCMIDDFHGGIQAEDAAWYARAATTCLDKAAILGRSALHDQIRQRLVDLTSTPARDWARLDHMPDRLGSAGDGGSTLVRSTLVLDERIAAAVPSGEAALWVTDGQSGGALPLSAGAASGATVGRMVLPVARAAADGRPQGVEWRVDRTAAGRLAARQGGTMDVAAWFRGHRILHEIRVGGGGGVQPVVWRRSTDAPRVTVHGSRRRHGYVSFIFDCSGSMERNAPAGRRRFDVGREAVDEVMQSMAKAGTWDASLWLYGHRTRWIKRAGGGHDPGLSAAGERERRAAEQAGRPFSLQPGIDVQQVLPMQPLGPGQVREVNQLISNLRPAGETPLYLALHSSLAGDSTAVAADAAWRVVVITDGMNDQTDVNPLTTARDVRETLATVNRSRTQPAHIDVLAFDLHGADELARLARDSGGQYIEAADPAALLKALRGVLELERWEIRDAAGHFNSGTEVGASIELPAVSSGTSARYSVAIAEKPGSAVEIDVTGGEGLELFVTENGRALEHRRYDGGTEQRIQSSQSDLVDPIEPRTRWFVAAHSPRRRGTELVFPVSVQNDDATRFSPRPVAWWAEVEPVGAGGSRPFVFFDAGFEPHRPVPVIDMRVPDWPREATKAALRVWFTTRPLEPAAQLSVAALENGVRQTFTFPGLPGIGIDAVLEKQTAGRGRLAVVERHPRETADRLPRLRVSLESGCDRAEHVVDVAAAEVRHEFDFQLDAAGGVPAGTRLSFLAAERLKEQAVGPAAPGGVVQPLQVPVPID